MADASAKAAVFVASEAYDGTRIQGPDFNQAHDLEQLLRSYQTIGFQAHGLSRAIELINKMRAWRLSDEKMDPDAQTEELDPEIRAATKCQIFLGYTSNLVSSGLREIIRFLVQHKMVTCLVTTAGGIEEDLIKCLGPTFVTPGGEFNLDGAGLRKRGLNRIGNLLVPNDNYCKFEDWVVPILDTMVTEQQAGQTWTPSKVINRLGKEIDDESSILYWAYKNDIPVFCPALTDGSLGDMMYFHSYKTETPLVIDIVGDIRRLNDLSVKSKKAGMIILGGGVCKHQIANSMLFRNGADYSVYINTGQEFDGSDSGARPDEAVSWGKIKIDGESVKVYADATLVFPLIVAATFGKAHWDTQRQA
ncbi:deoxyhypusine synthase [Microbotryum lychnidis-dioicae p1A1 Lamole]|uniref:deoxyhypusine synthase n=1 Tax=Microbotryum lychnidis-dioicae (strain p1A1 Lamole / MvSl-1064) TaxID=683840 RepID=U5GZQ5_USTV1|nr:deoxyhypusine synthase [Microbotryum lychnidis-dioicae p1A1 Lamole]|eukprot:KDE09337.1 deoxyhypusine synthase [Microbotryum lychnidis-dioicae p1A1 Lamole]